MKTTISTPPVYNLSLRVNYSTPYHHCLKETKSQHYVRHSIIAKHKNIQILQH